MNWTTEVAMVDVVFEIKSGTNASEVMQVIGTRARESSNLLVEIEIIINEEA